MPKRRATVAVGDWKGRVIDVLTQLRAQAPHGTNTEQLVTIGNAALIELIMFGRAWSNGGTHFLVLVERPDEMVIVTPEPAKRKYRSRLSPEERSEQGRKAVAKRWGKGKGASSSRRKARSKSRKSTSTR